MYAAPGAISMHDLEQLHIVHYPDPRLREQCKPVTQFDDALAALAVRMLQLMHEARGVGLAAPQVGILQRIFVMNHTGEPEDDRIIINPVLHNPHGAAESTEGCLSIPGVSVKVRRAERILLTGQDLRGQPVEVPTEDLQARVCQHETDHLNGILIVDRMGPTDRIATRKTLRVLENTYRGKARR